jgi:hypothetical protein
MWRIVWQFAQRLIGMPDSQPLGVMSLSGSVARHFGGVHLEGDIEPIFQGHPAHIRSALMTLRPWNLADPVLDLSGYYHAYTLTRADAEAVVAQLRLDPNVRYAEAQPPLSRPVIFSKRRTATVDSAMDVLPAESSPNLTVEQAYLDAAPVGVDARFAWTQPGGRGAGVRVVDVESGWNFRHEDLLKNHGGVIFGQADDSDHGTAVLGIFGANDIGVGVEGIAPDAFSFGASASWDGEGLKWNAAAAIQAAADRLAPGDVILLEMHAPGPNSPGLNPEQKGYIAVEYWDPEFAAIAYAVAKGIHVVEAAGNGGENLDAAVYAGRFDRKVRDSGAILVGGGHAPPDPHPRSRIWWSNYGARLDVQGWGEYIVTCGGLSEPNYHDRYTGLDESHCYTQSFGGTSGASPMVVGVVSCLSGVLKARGRAPLSPLAMRAHITATGTSQSASTEAPTSQHIGPLPNLRMPVQNFGGV